MVQQSHYLRVEHFGYSLSILLLPLDVPEIVRCELRRVRLARHEEAAFASTIVINCDIHDLARYGVLS